jgi:hypothetical protein
MVMTDQMATETKTTEVSIKSSLEAVERAITESIKSIQEEYQQVSELIEMEKSYTSEVATQLKQIIGPLGESYHLSPESVSRNDSSITDVVLTAQGVVCVFHNNGTVVARPLDSITSEVLVRVLGEAVPNIQALVSKRRQKLGDRVMSLEKLSKEMRKIPPIGSSSRKESQVDKAVHA